MIASQADGEATRQRRPPTATGLSLWRSWELAEKDCGRKWLAPPFARMVGRDFAYVNAFVITLSFLVGPQPRNHLAETAFLPIVGRNRIRYTCELWSRSLPKWGLSSRAE